MTQPTKCRMLNTCGLMLLLKIYRCSCVAASILKTMSQYAHVDYEQVSKAIWQRTASPFCHLRGGE